MSYRTILVEADSTPAAERRIAVAARVAKSFDAPLTGLFLRTSFPAKYFAAEPLLGLSMLVASDVFKAHDDATAATAEKARAAFEAVAGDAGAVSDWAEIDADSPDALIDRMRRTDLTILPRELSSAARANGLISERLALDAGGPVLLLPEEPRAETIGRRVMVAWNGSREAARALGDAWPFLTRAETVHVVVVAPHEDEAPEALLQRRLESHGCRAEVVIDRHDDASAAERLLAHAREFDADLMVMGLYGHLRLQELVLGGVSRDMIRRAPMALLVSH